MASLRERSIGAVLYSLERGRPRYLLLHRSAHGVYSEHWGLPRGLAEKGESEVETARRELMEETGIGELEFIPGFRMEVRFHYRREGRLVVKTAVYLLARAETTVVSLSAEHDSHAWLPVEEALERLSHKGEREVLSKAHRHLTKGRLDSYLRPGAF